MLKNGPNVLCENARLVGEECEVGWRVGGEVGGWVVMSVAGGKGRQWWWLERPPPTAVERDEDVGMCEGGVKVWVWWW